METKTWIYIMWKTACFYARRHFFMTLWALLWICWGIYVSVGTAEWILRFSTCLLIGALPYGIYRLIRRLDGHPNAKEKLAEKEQLTLYLRRQFNKNA